MAKLTVSPKLRQKRPTSPPMKATGKKIAMSETVVATTASTISFDPVTAASQGERFSSSMWRKMFSSTMIASSITMPVETERPSIVTLFSVNPAHRMAKKVAMIEVGMETAAMSAGRQFRHPRKTHTIRLARRAPRMRWCCTSPSARLMKRDWSRTTSIVTSGGSVARRSPSRVLTRSTTATVLVPDCFRTRSDTALFPSRRDSVRGSSSASRTWATSRTRTGPRAVSATTMVSKSATAATRPRVRRPSSRPSPVRRPPGTSTFCRASAVWNCWIDSP